MVTATCTRAFTLIELLVVIAIIVILASLVLAALGLVGESAKVTITKERMSTVERGLTSARTGDAATLQAIQDALTAEAEIPRRRWDTLATIFTHLAGLDSDPLDLQAAADVVDDFDPVTPVPYLPPGLASIHDPDIGGHVSASAFASLRNHATLGVAYLDSGTLVAGPDPTLDRLILFREHRDFTYREAFGTFKYDGVTAEPAPPPRRQDGSATKYFVHRNDPQRAVEATGVFRDVEANAELRHAWLYSQESSLGETLTTTFEVMPDVKQPRSWYLEAWPILREHAEADGTIVQHAWPDSDWNREDPGGGDGTIEPPIWEAPFAAGILSRKSGEVVDQYLRRSAADPGRSLADFTPMATIALLRLAGVLEEPADYRQDRDHKRPWNDAWGNPLLVVGALYIAPRYDLDPDFSGAYYDFLDIDGNPIDVALHDQLQGGRDWLIAQSNKHLSFSRKAYLAVAALGPQRSVVGDYSPADEANPITDDLPGFVGNGPLKWEESLDHRVLRAAWLQVIAACSATSWTDQVQATHRRGFQDKSRGNPSGLLTAPKGYP